MAKFFDTFNVIRGDGEWQQGYPTTTLGSGFRLSTEDICTPSTPPALPESSMGNRVYPFALRAQAEVPPRCAPNYVGEVLEQAFEESTEWAITKALWDGPDVPHPESNMYLTHPDIETMTRGSDPFTTVGLLLERAFEKSPYLSPVIHLGFTSAMSLQLGLSTLGIPFVVPRGYPANAIAVTGPVYIRIGSVQNISEVNTSINRQYFEANRIAAIEFDPAEAVRSV